METKKENYVITTPTLTACKGIGEKPIHQYAIDWGKKVGEGLYEIYKNAINLDIEVLINERLMDKDQFRMPMKGNFKVITSDGNGSDFLIIVFVFVAKDIGMQFDMRWKSDKDGD